MKKQLLFCIILYISASLWASTNSAHISFYSGKTIYTQLLWANDSLLYVWNGPKEVTLPDSQRCKVHRLDTIERIKVCKGKSLNQCFRYIFYASSAGYFMAFSSGDLVFVPHVIASAGLGAISAIIAGPILYYLQALPRTIDRPMEMPASYIHQHYGNYFFLDAKDDAKTIKDLEAKCMPQ